MEIEKVPGAGLEPAQPRWPQDFKSCVSTDSTIRAKTKKGKCNNDFRIFIPRSSF